MPKKRYSIGLHQRSQKEKRHESVTKNINIENLEKESVELDMLCVEKQKVLLAKQAQYKEIR